MTGHKPFPPYAKQYLEAHPDPGVVVVVGGDAWQFAARSPFPVMVLPAGRPATDFDWPSNGAVSLVRELGPADDDRLTELATALLEAGSPSVIALRHSLRRTNDCQVFFERAHDAA